MKCPSCQSRFETRSTGGVEIDECSGCQGIWLDADELRQVKDGSDKDLNWMDFELWKHPDRFRVNSNRMKCPTCTTALVAIDYDDTGVEVDFCTQCRGVWLDGGELEKIIAHLSEELLTKDTSAYVRASLEEAKELVTGPESFLSEWRDLATVLRMLQYRLLSENPRLGSALAEFQAKSQV
jgi:Zn-finger nucleic acid-binding protein